MNTDLQRFFEIHSAKEICMEARRKRKEYGRAYVPCIVFYSDKRKSKKMIVNASAPSKIFKVSENNAVYRYKVSSKTFIKVSDQETLHMLRRDCVLGMVFLYVLV